jgi:hypothetical protein
VPFFLMLETLSTPLLILGFVVGLGILYPAILAPQAAYYAELFATRTRLSGFAFAARSGRCWPADSYRGTGHFARLAPPQPIVWSNRRDDHPVRGPQ